MSRTVSCRIKYRYSASMITVAAYHRHGCSQSCKQIIVRPHFTHRYRRTQITIHPSTKPRTCRLYKPCPCAHTFPTSRANCPQWAQNGGRSSSTEGAPVPRATENLPAFTKSRSASRIEGSAMVRSRFFLHVSTRLDQYQTRKEELSWQL
jgi:hypothetical protein